MTRPDPAPRAVSLCVPEIRDYDRINAELVQHLDEGYTDVRLTGVEGQRFLAAGLAGPWTAVVEVEGRAGPELAAALNAPGLTVVCHDAAADGAGRGLRAGRLVIVGDAGEGLGYAMEGGTLIVAGAAAARAGLNQRGGTLIVLGPLGPLAAERQSGGRFFAFRDRLGPYAGRARRSGRLILLETDGETSADIEPDERLEWQMIRRVVAPWGVSFPGGS